MGQNITCDECGREHPQAMSAQQQGKDEDGAERLRPLCFLCARALPPDETILVRAAMLKGITEFDLA